MNKLNQQKTASFLGTLSILCLIVVIVSYFGRFKGIDFMLGALSLFIAIVSICIAIILNKRNPLYWIVLAMDITIIIFFTFLFYNFSLPN